MISIEIKKGQKRLKNIQKNINDLRDKYDEAVESCGCIKCEKYNRGNVLKLADRHTKCEGCKDYSKIVKIAIELEDVEREKEEFVEEFAKIIFDYYSKRKPELIRNVDNKKVNWDEDYGCEYDRLSKALKESLVGLFDGDGRYRLK